MAAYYNEIDPYAAQWLRNLIAAGHIAAGDVDERSIEDVKPVDLLGYDQCHFFAGIGVWSYALRQAGWPDDKPVWTGSCPCQPFSAAGKGGGFDDERHLWPAWFHLIGQLRPPVIFGEQVASKAVNPWIDLVQTDLEAVGYGFGAVPFPSAGVGAPHIRDRAYWLAQPAAFGRRGRGDGDTHGRSGQIQTEGRSALGVALGDTNDAGSQGRSVSGADSERLGASELAVGAAGSVDSSALDNSADARHHDAREHGSGSPLQPARLEQSGATNGFWRDADWLPCIDGKTRPVEPGTFPLAHGAPARVGRLRAYGNAINAEAAKNFILAYTD